MATREERVNAKLRRLAKAIGAMMRREPPLTRERALEIVLEAASEYIYVCNSNDIRDSERNRSFSLADLIDALNTLESNDDTAS